MHGINKIKKVTVVGTGVMGPGIALSFAIGGIEVALVGRTGARLKQSMARIRKSLDRLCNEGLVDDKVAVLDLIKGFVSLKEGLHKTELVVEAISEDIELKKSLFSEIDSLCSTDVIFATNTSGLSITEMASATSRPERFIGTHFWNPPHLIPLVEVVRGSKTRDDTVLEVKQLLERMGKVPVIVNKDVPGFVGTRLHQALIREAFFIVEEGIANVEDVDKVVKASFGRRLAITGPFETCDLGGLDTFLAAAEVWKHLSNAQEPSRLLRQKVEAGDLGAKSGRGLYSWPPERLENIQRQREEVLLYFLKLDKRGG